VNGCKLQCIYVKQQQDIVVSQCNEQDLMTRRLNFCFNSIEL